GLPTVVPTVGSSKSSSRPTRSHHGPPTQSASQNVAIPSGNGNGNSNDNDKVASSSNAMGGFDWPQPSGKPKPSTTTEAPISGGNSTATLPTGTAALSSLSSINYSTVSSFLASIPSGLTSLSATSITAAPTPTVTDVVGAPGVVETVWQT